MKFNTGNFDHLITIKSPTKTKGAGGSVVDVFDNTVFENVSCSKFIDESIERFSDDQLMSVTITTWTTHYLEGVNSTMRVYDQETGDEYTIISEPLELQRRMGLEIKTKLSDAGAT